ncbi:MAG: type II secretion system F family protein [Candidatus Aenigmarchaeota archaeon]|nr:type II secretion system F family protein [Candidatus Aenigmarchaeota archaeon]
MGRKLIFLLCLSASIAGLILYANFTIFSEEPNIFATLNVIAILIFALPIILMKYKEYSRVKELERMFPVFLRDFVESVRSGMTISQAFKSVSLNDYKALSYYVKKMAAQMDWGIAIEKVLLRFSKESKSKLIGRVISSVIESHKFGGNLTNTLEALGNTALEIEKLRAERRLYLQSQLMTGYTIYFVFLAVIIILQKFLIPSFAQTGEVGLPISQPQMIEEYKSIFRNLIMIQGFFAGLVVGKIAEGAMIAGIKHSIVMTFAGIVTYTLVA